MRNERIVSETLSILYKNYFFLSNTASNIALKPPHKCIHNQCWHNDNILCKPKQKKLINYPIHPIVPYPLYRCECIIIGCALKITVDSTLWTLWTKIWK